MIPNFEKWKLGSETRFQALYGRRIVSHFGWANQNYSDGSRNESANIQIENLDQNLEWVILNDVPLFSNSSDIPTSSQSKSSAYRLSIVGKGDQLRQGLSIVGKARVISWGIPPFPPTGMTLTPRARNCRQWEDCERPELTIYFCFTIWLVVGIAQIFVQFVWSFWSTLYTNPNSTALWLLSPLHHVVMAVSCPISCRKGKKWMRSRKHQAVHL